MMGKTRNGIAHPAGWMARRELALTYFPSASTKVAVARLNRWIATDPQFRAALLEKGYRPRIRCFSPSVVRVFRRFLG